MIHRCCSCGRQIDADENLNYCRNCWLPSAEDVDAWLHASPESKQLMRDRVFGTQPTEETK